MFTMRPQPRSRRCGHTACEQLNAPVRLTRRSRSQSSGCWSWNWPTWSSVPALLTRMSTDPSSSTTRATAAVYLLAVGDVASHGERAAAERADLLDRRLGVHHPLRDGRLREHAVLLGGARVRLEEDVCDRDVGSRAREHQRVGAAEATRAARDERDPAGEVDLERHRRDPMSWYKPGRGADRRRPSGGRGSRCGIGSRRPRAARRPRRRRGRRSSSTRPTPPPSSSR